MTGILVRTVIMYLLVIAALRIMGKRQLGQLEPSELVATIIMSELAAMPIVDAGLPVMHAVAAVAAIFALEMVMSEWVLRSIKARRLLCGKPSILVENGAIIQSELRRNRLSVDELIEGLRLKDIMDPSTVRYAILEANGSLSVILKPECQPVTAAQMNIVCDAVSMPVIVISDGRWLSENIDICGLSREYIDGELRKRQISDISQVFLLMIDRQHNFYLFPQDRGSLEK